MQLSLDISTDGTYHSNRQIARIITERWFGDNMYCPHCGSLHVLHSYNNRPVEDFYCENCNNEYELKSKQGSIGKKIADGAYATMIERITGNDNPDFFFMQYSIEDKCIKNIVLVPKYFFVPDIIEKRKPLPETARRAGWVGCNILLNNVPEQGRIQIVKNGVICDKSSVVNLTQKSEHLAVKDVNKRGWLMDTLLCVNALKNDEFTLEEMYRYEDILGAKHPDNHNVKPKIRQQLQMLRDKGVIEFVRRGLYRKVRN